MLDDFRPKQPTEIESQLDRATTAEALRTILMDDLVRRGLAVKTASGEYVCAQITNAPATEAARDARFENATNYEDIHSLAIAEREAIIAGFVAPPVPKQPEHPKLGESLHMDVLVNGRVHRIFADSYGGLDIQFANLQKHFGATEI
jgi:hypothetical protein